MVKTIRATEEELLVQYRESAAQRSARITELVRELNTARQQVEAVRQANAGLKEKLERAEKRLQARLEKSEKRLDQATSRVKILEKRVQRNRPRPRSSVVRAARKARRIARRAHRRARSILSTRPADTAP